MSSVKSYLPDFVWLSIEDQRHIERSSGHHYRAAVAGTTLLQQEDLDGGSEGDSRSAKTVGPLADVSPEPEVDSRQGRAVNTESWQSGTPQVQGMKPEVEDFSIIVTTEPPGQMSADVWVKTQKLSEGRNLGAPASAIVTESEAGGTELGAEENDSDGTPPRFIILSGCRCSDPCHQALEDEHSGEDPFADLGEDGHSNKGSDTSNASSEDREAGAGLRKSSKQVPTALRGSSTHATQSSAPSVYPTGAGEEAPPIHGRAESPGDIGPVEAIEADQQARSPPVSQGQ